MKVRDFCSEHNISSAQYSGEEKIEGSLDLRGLTSIPEGFNPTVGGSLDLSGLTSIPEGFNPTVGGSLDLRGLTSIPEGFNPTVGGSLYLRGLTTPVRKPTTDLLFFQDGKYVLADGIFTEIVRKIGNVFVVRKLNTDVEFFLVTDFGFVHAHGDTIEKANADFRLKLESY